MKQILLISATEAEIFPFLKQVENTKSGVTISILITGPGMVPSVFQLTRKLSTQKFDLVVHAGIAGSFKKSFVPGTLVEIVKDCFADTGARDKDGSFLSMVDLGLWQKDEPPFLGGYLHPFSSPGVPDTKLPQASGITVSTVNGCETDIGEVRRRLDPDVETIEAAAVMYVCHQFALPLVSIRAISNFVEPRNRAAWDIPLAVRKLNDFLVDWFSRF